ncbi:MAG: hypothetical protein MRERC_1c106 [Mycoplasmataceae bacterium RC_NB112A]|nr:MAG: hypothetical protein MRERC_1c106 [Mycoplasmataceae bacterium RC_NB112A]
MQNYIKASNMFYFRKKINIKLYLLKKNVITENFPNPA